MTAQPTETLRDAGGTPVADYFTAPGERTWVVVTALHAAPEEAAAAVVAAFAGSRVVTDDDAFADALLARGGVLRRRGHDYAFDLATVPPECADARPPEGFALAPVGDPDALVAAHEAAYPPEHRDHEADLDHTADVRAMVGGEILGPLAREASWQVSDADGPCGALLVVDRPAGPQGEAALWVVDVFVHPRHRGQGLGAVLLRRGLAGGAAAGHRRMGLVVTDGNPARGVYEALGFVHVKSGSSIDI
ncbi:MAG TPA: GNAT family N-acetyltransferase [Mycobacteriales bacterium]|nr:GNAT family N-acetyltransferase [Mycobacteriales bacterium]